MLGEIVDRLDNPAVADTLLQALGAPELAVRLAVLAGDEAPATAMARIMRSFLDNASDEHWVQLIGSMQRAADPTLAALHTILSHALPNLAAAIDAR